MEAISQTCNYFNPRKPVLYRNINWNFLAKNPTFLSCHRNPKLFSFFGAVFGKTKSTFMGLPNAIKSTRFEHFIYFVFIFTTMSIVYSPQRCFHESRSRWGCPAHLWPCMWSDIRETHQRSCHLAVVSTTSRSSWMMCCALLSSLAFLLALLLRFSIWFNRKSRNERGRKRKENNKG